MTIELKPEQKRTIELAIESGAYQDPSDVLDHAFDILREQLHHEDWMTDQRELISARLDASFAQAEGGELMDGEAAFEMLRRRRAERRQNQG